VAEALGFQLLDPCRHNGSQRLHGQFFKSSTEELLQLDYIANVECVRLFRCDSGLSVITLLIVVVVFVVVVTGVLGGSMLRKAPGM
jgi:hypothetical protein